MTQSHELLLLRLRASCRTNRQTTKAHCLRLPLWTDAKSRCQTPQRAVNAYFKLSLLDPVLVYGCSICLEWYHDKQRSGVRSTFTTTEEKFLPAISALTQTIAWLGGSSLLSPHHREELYRLPLSAREPTILRNLYHLHQYFPEIISSTEIALFHILDAYPDKMSETLRSMMTVRIFFGSCHVQVLMRLQAVKCGKVALSQFPRRSFETLGVQWWVDDDVVKYLVNRWCSKSLRTLGLGTWFACKFLFQDTQCVHAKTRTLTSEDELGMQKWCRTAEVQFLFWFTGFAKSRVEGPRTYKLGLHVHSN